MPMDAMIVTALVVSVFTVFAGVLFWGDMHTRPPQRAASQPKGRRRSF